MELLYLLFSILSASLTTLFYSLLFLFKSLILPLFLSPAAKLPHHTEGLTFYQGHVHHVRRRPALHSFQYQVRYALIDLDRVAAPATLPPSFFRSHLSAEEARGTAGTAGPVFLLTVPPSVGYEQNPLSVYYCYDLEGSTTQLKKCIAEVTNTPWGERVSFVFHQDSDIVAKPLHVSPFMDMLGSWKMHATAPGEDLFIDISVQHPELGDYFTATLRAKRVYLPHSVSPALFFWLMPQRVALWIYWQALKLWWKNVAFQSHPKYINPMYREKALMRDRKLRCPMTAMKHHGNYNSNVESSEGREDDHWFVWKDAQWPWS